MDDPAARTIVRPSQGVHIVLDRSFLPGDSAIMVPHTDDGRVLFAVPWHDRVIVGTTDTPIEEPTLEPRPLEEELDFLLTHAVRYLTKDPSRDDVLSTFAGLRPLVARGGKRGDDDGKTSSISRDHTLLVSRDGLVTITGGKWTTYRKMAEDTVDQLAETGGLEPRPCPTEGLHLHGWREDQDPADPRTVYGADADAVHELAGETAAGFDLSAPLHESLPCTRAEIVWGARHEMSRTVDDALSRRTRSLLLDARAAAEAAEDAARLMAAELGRDEGWVAEQAAAFRETARGYLPQAR
jgi:glycerol-3-phosphate dehydrogenase